MHVSSRRRLTMISLASGSGGNCTWLGDGRNGVLVDCGISTRRILRSLDALGFADAPVDAVLITHEHSDHVASCRVLCDALARRRGRPVPFFMTAGTLDGVPERCRPSAVETLAPGEGPRLGGLDVSCFSIPHDVRDPVGWQVRAGGTRAVVATDLGRPTALVARVLRGAAIALLEFNHDEELLLAGPYSWPLKQRIRSSHGHLSNEQAGELLQGALTGLLSHLVLGHLSEENNSPALAFAAARRVLDGHPATVAVARPDRPLDPLSVEVRDS